VCIFLFRLDQLERERVEERKEKGGKEKRRRRGKDPDCID
jgi:hypothetical protein